MLKTSAAGDAAGSQPPPEALPRLQPQRHGSAVPGLEEELGGGSSSPGPSTPGGLSWFPSSDGDQPSGAEGHLKPGSSGGLWKALDGREDPIMAPEASARLEDPEPTRSEDGLEAAEEF